MNVWLRSVRDWTHLARLPATAWELPAYSVASDAGSVTVPGEIDDCTGDWLICDGQLFTVKSCAPKNGMTTIAVLLAEEAFSRQLRFTGTGAETFGAFLASALQDEYIDQTDAMYSMPYLSVSNSDTTPFEFPVETGQVYTLLQIIRLAASAGVYLIWTPSVSGLAVSIAARPAAEHRLFFSGGHEQLISQTYTRSIVAKATVRQTQTDRDTGEVTVLDEATYYFHSDGSYSLTPPAPRIPGEWVLIDVNEKKTLEEGAAAAFGKNTQAYKIEFYSDKVLKQNDVVLCRIGRIVARGVLTYARRSSKDNRWLYRAGNAPTTLTEKLAALQAAEGGSV